MAFSGKTVYRQMVFLKKKAGLSDAEFKEYWSTGHSDLIKSLSTFSKYVVRYEQVYLNGDEDDDGIAVLDYRSKEDWKEFTSSKEWKEQAAPDTANFADVSSVRRMFSNVQIHFEAA